MFLLVVIEDKVKIAPELFDREITEVVIELIEIKYLNKVIQLIHLLICADFC